MKRKKPLSACIAYMPHRVRNCLILAAACFSAPPHVHCPGRRWPSLPKFVRVCKSLSEFVRVCQSLPKFVRVCRIFCRQSSVACPLTHAVCKEHLHPPRSCFCLQSTNSFCSAHAFAHISHVFNSRLNYVATPSDSFLQMPLGNCEQLFWKSFLKTGWRIKMGCPPTPHLNKTSPKVNVAKIPRTAPEMIAAKSRISKLNISDLLKDFLS